MTYCTDETREDRLEERIEKLEARNARLRGALEPFARAAQVASKVPGFSSAQIYLWTEDTPGGTVAIKLSDCESALAALSDTADDCGNCGGTGEVDSGASDPQGNFIDIPCPECSEPTDTWLTRHDERVRREYLLSLCEPDIQMTCREYHNDRLSGWHAICWDWGSLDVDVKYFGDVAAIRKGDDDA